MGQDRSLVYMRTPKEVSYEKISVLHPKGTYPLPRITSACYGNYRFQDPLYIRDYVIGFCGKIYPTVKLENTDRRVGHHIESFCFTQEEVDKFIIANFNDKQIESYYIPKKERKKFKNRYGWNWWHRHDIFAGFFKECAEKKDKFEKLFLEHAAPLFIGDHIENSIVFNGELKKLEFFRVFDPFQAFQEISMYLGGVAVPQKTIPPISDETMLEAKGFDKKFSFRKPKS